MTCTPRPGHWGTPEGMGNRNDPCELGLSLSPINGSDPWVSGPQAAPSQGEGQGLDVRAVDGSLCLPLSWPAPNTPY